MFIRIEFRSIFIYLFPWLLLFALGSVSLSIPPYASAQSPKDNANSVPSGKLQVGHVGKGPRHNLIRPFHPNIESLILKWTNAERRKRHIPLLKISAPLNRLAEAHSRNQARTGIMGHNSEKFPKGWQTFDERIKRLHFSAPATYGENIFWTSAKLPLSMAGLDNYCRKAVQAWMSSPGHRRNILSVKFGLMGLGYCNGYITQLFASQSHKDELKTRSEM